MNSIELQDNFEKACFYYASKFDVVESFNGLLIAEYQENKNKKDGEPNYYKVITKWNHKSSQPKDAELMKFTTKEVNEFYEKNKNEDEGAMPFKIKLNGAWEDVLLKPADIF